MAKTTRWRLVYQNGDRDFATSSGVNPIKAHACVERSYWLDHRSLDCCDFTVNRSDDSREGSANQFGPTLCEDHDKNKSDGYTK